MANILFGYPNRIMPFVSGAGVLTTPVLYGGSWQLPLTNLQDNLLATVARSTDLQLAHTQFGVDLSESRLIGLVAIPKHTLSLTAQIRIRTWLEAGLLTLQFDSGWMPVWPSVYLPEDVQFEDDNWWIGTISAEDQVGYPAEFVYQLPAITYAEFLSVEFSDPSNINGYIDISSLVISPGYQPSRNLVYGATISWETDTKITTSLGGVDNADHRPTYRVITFSLPYLPKQEGYSKVFEMMRKLGTDGAVFVSFDPGDALNLQRHSFLGRLRKLGGLKMSLPNRTATDFEIKELL